MKERITWDEMKHGDIPAKIIDKGGTTHKDNISYSFFF